MQLVNELMRICTILQRKLLDLEDDLKKTKTTPKDEVAELKKRVKRLEKKNKSRTQKLKRLYKVRINAKVIESSSDKETILDKEDAFKQGRIDKIDADKDISL
nr:hypothetical protein [Tanacetum cinerariifolium]